MVDGAAMTDFRTSPETIGCGTPGCADPNCTYGRDDDWPPVKMALWRVLMDEQLNSGKYIKAFDLIEKLHAAVLTSGVAPTPGLGPGVIERMVTNAWNDARREAIEECAKICDNLRHEDYSSETPEWSGATLDCARAIRALAQGPDTSTDRTSK